MNRCKYIFGCLLMFGGISCIDSSPCRVHVCLSWKIENNSLVFTCKVDDFDFVVVFDDPLDKSRAFCHPNKECKSFLHDSDITQNNSTNEIVLMIHRPTNTSFNGWWTCRYGHANEKARVEVTTTNVSPSDSTGETTQLECYTLAILWTALGYACAYMLILLTIFIFARCFLIEQTICTCTDTIFSYCGEPDQHSRFSLNERKRIAFFVLCFVAFALPGGVGYMLGAYCDDRAPTFSLIGVAIGIVCCLLLVNKGDYNVIRFQNGRSQHETTV